MAPPLPADPLEALDEAARREVEHPRASVEIDVPAGIDPALLRKIDLTDEAGKKASRPLDDVTRELLQTPAIEARPAEDRPPPAMVTQALRLYAQAREKEAGGDAAGAVTDLEQATKLDPGSAEAWRELGDAQTAAGRRLAAISSYTQACQRGLTDGRIWWILGRDALRSKKLDQAASLLAKARSHSSETTDPALEYIISADLGEALMGLGYQAAGLEALAQGASLPTPLPWTTRLRTEVIDLIRKRADLRRDAGDAAVRLGDTMSALKLYEAAAEDEQGDSSELLVRRVYALWSSGRPAATASLIASDIAQQTTPVSDAQIELVRRLAADPSAGPLLAPALDVISRSSQVPGATAQRQWVRVRAAAAGMQGRAILRAGLAQAPESESLFRDLIDTLPRNDPQARAGELLQLVEQSPRSIGLLSRLISTTTDSAGELAALERSGTWAASLVRVPWLINMARVPDAVKAADALAAGKSGAYAAAARAQAYAAAGLYDRIDEQLGIMKSVPAADNPLLVAWTLAECQRYTDAFDSLPAHGSASAMSLSPEQKLAAAGICLRAGKFQEAESFVLATLQSDPFNDEGYELLSALYAPASPLASEEKLAQTVRILRQAAPASRVVQWLTAQEMITRRMDSQALGVLTTLVEQGYVTDPLMTSLTGLLERKVALGGDAAEQCVTLMRRLVTRHPEVPSVWAGLARVLAAQGKGEEADAELARRLAVRPWPTLAATREALTRDVLKKPDLARKMALDRLSPAPRPIDATVSYAVELGRDGHLPDATAMLEKDLPARTELSSEQQGRLASLIASEYDAPERAGAAPALKRGANVQALSQLFDALARHGARFAPQMHQARISVLCAITPVDIPALRAACEQAARDVPSIAAPAYALAAQELINTSKTPQPAIPFLREAIRLSPEVSEQLLLSYFGLVAQYGAASDVESLEATVGGVPGEAKLLKRLLDAKELPDTDAKIRTEFLYQFGGLCTTRSRRDLTEVALLKVLEINPDHGLANNDLGYFYLEDGREQAAAERMLRRAYKVMPESHNVIDSFGWLRYQQGQLEDTTDAATGEVIPGAAALLAKAATMEGGVDNATVLDHLGDVQWRQGKADEAVRSWTKAQSVLSKQLADIDLPANASEWRTKLLAESREELARIRAKIEAVKTGKEPPVAKMIWSGGAK